jgi:hypothetical protein
MIDYNQFSKTSSTILGLFFSILAVVCFSLAVYIYKVDIPKPNKKLFAEKDLKVCEAIGKSKSGFTGKLDVNARKISFQKYGVTDGYTELMEAKNIIQRCNNMELKSFCIGNREGNNEYKDYGCDITGIEMVLEYKSPWGK